MSVSFGSLDMPNEKPPAPFELPSDLTALSPEDFAAITESARGEFNTIYQAEGGPQVDQLQRATELADAIDALAGEAGRRTQEAAETKAKFDELMGRVTPPATDGAESSGPAVEGEVVEPAAPSPQPVAASARPTGGAITASRELGGNATLARINPSLSGARALAPATQAPTGQLAITASADLPGRSLTAGSRINDLDTLVELVESRARSLPLTASGVMRNGRRLRGGSDAYGGLPVARMANSYA